LLGLGVIVFTCTLFAQDLCAQTTYQLKPTPKTVAWGYYDAKTPRVLRVKSGDTLEIQTLTTSSPKRLEEAVRMMLPKPIFVSTPSE
jgi:hypothetical protein